MGRRSAACAVGLVALVVISHTASAAQPMRAVVDANRVSVESEAGVVAEYCYGGVPFKPYVKELFTPSGLNVLLDAPHDHLHHHALMFAAAVDGVNFWEETPRAGQQKHLEFAKVTEAREDETPGAMFRERLEWLAPGGETLLTELRAVAVLRPAAPPVTLLRWGSRLTVPPGKPSVTLTGSHYFGLGLRFIRAMDGQGTFRNADNKPGTIFRGEERLVRSNWCAYTAQAGGRDVTVAMFDHPDNPRHPATWFTMAKPFAYLSATLGLHETPLEIVQGEPLELKYAVALWDRVAGPEEIDSLYRELSK